CLVGKLVERVKDKELVVFHGVVSEADVTVKLRAMLNKQRNKVGLKIIASTDTQYKEKIYDLFGSVFKYELSIIVYFDDFEQNLIRSGNEYNVKSEAIEVIHPFLEAVDWAEGSSNVVISSRYPFILEVDGEDLSRTKLVDITLRSFDGADLDKKASNLEFVAKSSHVKMYLRYGGGNPRLLEWLDVIARDEARYDLVDLEAQLKLKQGEFIHEFLADVIAETKGPKFHGFIRRAAVYGEPVDATAFAGFGGAQFLATGVDLTLVEREDVSRGEFVYWVTPVIRDAMWGNLTPGEQFEMHGLAYKWYSDWVKTSSEPNYKYLEEAVRHALAVGDIRGACPYARDLGRYFDGLVLYRQGWAIMEKVAVRVTDEVIGEAKAAKDVEVDSLLHAYAQSLWKLGDARQAIAFYEKSLAIFKEVYGERHPSVATTYNNMAIVYDETGDKQKAADYIAKAKAAWS
ncbi:tetratricopeptide repeat protein, partial [Candidatus Magnetobacterium casense]